MKNSIKIADIREQSLLDRLFGHFGYERRRSDLPTVRQTEHAVSVRSPKPAHRIAQARFDYARAELNSMSFSYHDDEDWFSYAVGKDNWMPLSIASMMLGEARMDAHRLIADYSRRTMWLDPESAEFSAWINANDAVFDRIATIERDPPVEATERQSQGWPEKFSLMGPHEVSYQYRLFWRRAHVDMSEDFLAVSDAHAEFCRLAEMRSVTVSLDALRESLTDLVEYWFEARGYAVDKDLHLVNVQGYEALFYSAEQGY
ncbi:MAG: hypothetical protein AB1704_20270 [Pseudomonadota bacterium]